MRSINFSTGIWREYALNGDETNTIRVNIADPNLEKRVNEADAAAHEWFERLKTDHSPQTLFEADEALRILLDTIFDAPISAKAFGKANLFTPVGEDGDFLLSAFLCAFAKVLEADAKAYAAELAPQPQKPRPEITRYLPPGKPIAGLAQPYGSSVPDVSGLTQEQKKALLAQLLA